MAVRYSLETIPQGRNDGSGYVDHNLMAQDDALGSWNYVPGYHKTFVVPASEIAVVMAMPDGTAQERQAKNAAYKNLLVAHAEDQPIPLIAPDVVGWDEAEIQQYRTDYTAWQTAFDAANAAAEGAADDINTYITVTLNQDYPVTFRLDLAL